MGRGQEKNKEDIMSLLGDKERDQVGQMFGDLVNPVKLITFTQEQECEFCEETRELIEELATLSDKVEAEIYDFVENADVAEKYGIDKIPAVAILGEKDYGIRYFGIPSGYEFSALIEDIQDVSAADSGLAETSRSTLAGLKEPLHIQVFTTPT